MRQIFLKVKLKRIDHFVNDVMKTKQHKTWPNKKNKWYKFAFSSICDKVETWAILDCRSRTKQSFELLYKKTSKRDKQKAENGKSWFKESRVEIEFHTICRLLSCPFPRLLFYCPFYFTPFDLDKLWECLLYK